MEGAPIETRDSRLIESRDSRLEVCGAAGALCKLYSILSLCEYGFQVLNQALIRGRCYHETLTPATAARRDLNLMIHLNEGRGAVFKSTH